MLLLRQARAALVELRAQLADFIRPARRAQPKLGTERAFVGAARVVLRGVLVAGWGLVLGGALRHRVHAQRLILLLQLAHLRLQRGERLLQLGSGLVGRRALWQQRASRLRAPRHGTAHEGRALHNRRAAVLQLAAPRRRHRLFLPRALDHCSLDNRPLRRSPPAGRSHRQPRLVAEARRCGRRGAA